VHPDLLLDIVEQQGEQLGQQITGQVLAVNGGVHTTR
jgi:hypothetical protein